MSNFITRPVGEELLYADGQTDMTKLIVAFRSFANATKSRNICDFYKCINYSNKLYQRVPQSDTVYFICIAMAF
jgi:hypothetical protein